MNALSVGVRRRGGERGRQVADLGDRRQVEDVVPDPDADPRAVVAARSEKTPYGRLSRPKREPAAPSTQVIAVVGHRGGSVASWGRPGRGDQVVERLATEQEPNEVNQRRARATSSAVDRQPGGVALLERRDVVARGVAVERARGGEQDVEEAVVLEALRVGVPDGVVQARRCT